MGVNDRADDHLNDPSHPPRETRQQHREHQVRLVTHVVPELELAKVPLQVLLRDADVRAVDAALHEVPEAFNGVRRVPVLRQLASTVLDDRVLVVAAHVRDGLSKLTHGPMRVEDLS